MALPGAIRRQPRVIGTQPTAVLITKQDYDKLQGHVRPVSGPVPPSIPRSDKLVSRLGPKRGGDVPRQASIDVRDANVPSRAAPPLRRTRSASLKRCSEQAPTPPPLPYPSAGHGVIVPHILPPAKATVPPTEVKSSRPTRNAENRGGSLSGPCAPGRPPAAGMAGFNLGRGSGNGAPALGIGLGFEDAGGPGLAVMGMSKLQKPPHKAPDPLPQAPGMGPTDRLLGMMISGGAMPMHGRVDAPDGSPATDFDIKAIEAWSSSEDEVDAADSAELEGSEADMFQYKRYRYSESRAKAAPPEPVVKRKQHRSSNVRRDRAHGAGNDSDEGDGFASPWTDGGAVHLRTALHDGQCVSQSSTPRCEEEQSEQDQLRRVASTLIQFYGLSGAFDEVVKLKHGCASNAVVVDDAAWAKRRRESQLEFAPVLWLRGDRVYDFHGDRGTVDEFEHDLLTRHVEDDATCRLRRREQGLMPFPFLPLPLKRSAEADDDDADGASKNAGRR
eukprot:TRINITY_DN23231_c0_g1_i1.p1 TRINITY_DN23231_c0_g1~~TRINITY_DN23231_c0_g1_i1.p1  ORF type:complete len:501 (+),score=64.07 TRINITY_DN23231_c0_g1_i1:134-1636(+)